MPEEERQHKPMSRLQRLRLARRTAGRFKRHPEEIDDILTPLKDEQGIPEANITILRDAFLALHDVWTDDADAYAMDRYFLTGIGALDVVLIAVILPIGAADQSLFIATLLLALSLVLTCVSLFVGFINQRVGVIRYFWFHALMVSGALITGAGALAATFWHVSGFIGWVFTVLAGLAYLSCLTYAVAMHAASKFVARQERQQMKPSDEHSPETPQPSEP